MSSSLLSSLLCLKFQSRSDIYDSPAIVLGNENKVWYQVNREIRLSKSTDCFFWWNHIGSALGALLYHAGYSHDAQYRHLSFFARIIAPHLGLPPDSQKHWKTFMTDDGNPVELSYEWATNDAPPKIRYSVEPIGPRAGTLFDSRNKSVIKKFDRLLFSALPETNLVWFKHFERELRCRHRSVLPAKSSNRSTHRFYAFDLEDDEITVKAYFFPRLRARETKTPVLETISQAILSAPQWGDAGTQALTTFRAFATKARAAPLEMDMLAIDLVEPRQSRVKVYFRSRETDFESVIDNLTLGDRARTTALEKGIENLRALWDALFEADSRTGTSLRPLDHRTAGILYYVEFRLGNSLPVTKIYIPVRHYSSNDQHIMNSLSAYLKSTGNEHSIANYHEAMASLL